MSLSTGNQLKAARALANVDQAWVARVAGVNVNTIRNMEACGFDLITSSAATVQRVQRCLEALGIEFLQGKDPGVVLREITGVTGVQDENGEWGIAIASGGHLMMATSVALAREMARDAEKRGDKRTAGNLMRAADRAENERSRP